LWSILVARGAADGRNAMAVIGATPSLAVD
jgi:hypothetical protein